MHLEDFRLDGADERLDGSSKALWTLRVSGTCGALRILAELLCGGDGLLVHLEEVVA